MVESAALTGGAILLAVELVQGGSSSLGVSAFLIAFALGMAFLLLQATRALLRSRRWARSPIATWQILQTIVALAAVGAAPVPAVLSAVLALVVMGLLLSPAVVAWTTGHPPTQG